MDTTSRPSASSRTPGRLGRDVQAKIGNQLRAIYDNVVREGVPDRFVDLLKRLDLFFLILQGGQERGKIDIQIARGPRGDEGDGAFLGRHGIPAGR